jgi:hypothetical protein
MVKIIRTHITSEYKEIYLHINKKDEGLYKIFKNKILGSKYYNYQNYKHGICISYHPNKKIYIRTSFIEGYNKIYYIYDLQGILRKY